MQTGLKRGLVGLALTAGAVIVLGGASAWVSQRYCKPVVPQIIVELSDDGTPLKEADLFLTYVENTERRNEETGRYEHVRFSGCYTHLPDCKASRARYEVRFEGAREQVIQVRGMGLYKRNGDNIPGNLLIGEVQWKGASYPHRVVLECDIAQAQTKKACRIREVIEGLDEAASRHEGPRSRHDQCRPEGFGLASIFG